jgi:hypothetical protein
MNKDLINELVEMEMDESCHNDYPEDYNNKLEFYLSNAEMDSYINYLTDNRNVNEEEAMEIQKSVISEIKRRYEIIQMAAAMAGKKGGSVKSEAKTRASRENGKKGGRPKMKTYYSVKYSAWGADSPRTAWFDDKEKAKEFAAHDYRDDPIAHRTSKLDKIAEYDELVAITEIYKNY